MFLCLARPEWPSEALYSRVVRICEHGIFETELTDFDGQLAQVVNEARA